MKDMYAPVIVVVVAILYVMLMNWTGGEKYLIGNNIRELIQMFKNLKKAA